MTRYILLLIFSLSAHIFSQISPGELSRAHSKLDGLSNCTKCHELGKNVTNSKCLECHTEIKALQNRGKGYHASGEVKAKECFKCHSEHNGLNFKVIKFDKNNFDHSKTGYPLKGKHSEADCNDCHNQKNIREQKLKARKNTWLGLETNCSSCHEDYHNKTLGSNCEKCHTSDGFKSAKLFDHNTASFRLRDAHTRVECSKCHQSLLNPQKNFLVFKVAKYSACSNCHQDIHKGKFGNNCTECHSTVSFKSVSTGKFDHSKTNFPLAGAHIKVECKNCHGASLTSRPAHSRCSDCHKDYHKGEFIIAGTSKDCSDCHNGQAFTPSDYTIERHSSTKFPLTGRHLSIPCSDCHLKQGEYKFKVSAGKCIDCHENIHGGELVAIHFPNQNCGYCHNTGGWNNITFDHSNTEFGLSGKHADLNCDECHKTNSVISGEKIIFASLKKNCTSCHDDIHYGQFKNDKDDYCLSCHSFEGWKPVSFTHSNTRFPLTGAHEKVSCDKCHKTISTDKGTFVKYRMDDYKCVFCHY